MHAFARTKIQPPRLAPGALLARPALVQRLAEDLVARPLVLVSAPAGYGKTSAVAQGLAALPAGVAAAWVGCDAGDSPLQLFGCLVASLEPFDLPWRQSPEALIAAALDSAPAGPEAGARSMRLLATALINALDAAEVPHGVIVVDDLHRVDHPAVFAFLDLLLERPTARWSLVLSTRVDPPLALQRLRARGQLGEYRAGDLQFDLAQARELARRQGLSDAAGADALHARTEGWPAGLQLALQVLRSRPGAELAGSASLIDRQVFEFLATEVLDALPEALREFLLATAVLPELTAARCAALSGDARAAEHLEAIERAGLFVSVLDGPEPTLRLHDLMRDALQHRLQRLPGDRLRRQLEQAAASEPDPVRRLACWLRAECWPEAARELHRQSLDLLTGGQAGTVQRWLERFPPAAHEALPELQLVHTLLGWMYWRWADMGRSAEAAAAGFERTGRPPEALLAQAYQVLALRAGGDTAPSDMLRDAAATAVAEQLAAHAAEPGRGRRWGVHEPLLHAALLLRLAATWQQHDDAELDALPAEFARMLDLLDASSGRSALLQVLPLPGFVGLPGLRPLLARYVRIGQTRLGADDHHLATLLRAIEGSLHVWAGDLGAGTPLLREAADDLRWHDHPIRATLHTLPFLCVADALAGDGEALRADAAAFEQALERAAASSGQGARLAAEHFHLGRWLHAGGQIDAALRLWQGVAAAPPVDERQRLQAGVPDAWIALAEGRHAEALARIEQVLQRQGSRLERFGQATELRLRAAALALQVGRGPDQAALLLRPVLVRHAGDADLAAVWLAGAAVLHTLAGAGWQDRFDADGRATLRRWADGLSALQGEPRAVARADVALPGERLSAREQEVLARLAAGDSNKLIARAFDLSPHTVKRHVANILLKLDLRSRGQAAAWFHARQG